MSDFAEARMSRLKAKPSVWLLWGAVFFIPLLAIELLGSGPIGHVWHGPSDVELEALIAEGDAIVRALHAHQANHRQYPANLPGPLDISHGAKYGGWRYGCAVGCAEFELSVGDYRENSFRIHWQFDKRIWYIDG